MSKKEEKNPSPANKPEAKKARKIEKTPKPIKSSTSTTGLEDYGFWSDQVKKELAGRNEPDAPFRRGRIWA